MRKIANKITLAEGQRFGLLCVIREDGRDRHGRAVWLCACDCGGRTSVKATYLRTGHTVSCGCRKRAVGGERNKTHGRSGTKTHYAWKAMRQRCTNKNRPQWKDWGGRGIGYDPRWDSFEIFLEDMGEAPPGSWLERKDNNVGYSKDNCKWATPKEQNSNRRITRRVEFDGLNLTMKEWADELGIGYMTLLTRFLRGWSTERALSAGKFNRGGVLTPSKKED